MATGFVHHIYECISSSASMAIWRACEQQLSAMQVTEDMDRERQRYQFKIIDYGLANFEETYAAGPDIIEVPGCIKECRGPSTIITLGQLGAVAHNFPEARWIACSAVVALKQAIMQSGRPSSPCFQGISSRRAEAVS